MNKWWSEELNLPRVIEQVIGSKRHSEAALLLEVGEKCADAMLEYLKSKGALISAKGNDFNGGNYIHIAIPKWYCTHIDGYLIFIPEEYIEPNNGDKKESPCSDTQQVS